MIKLIDSTTGVAELWTWVRKVRDSGEWHYHFDNSQLPYFIFKFISSKYDFEAYYIPGNFFDTYCNSIKDAKTNNEVASIFMKLVELA